jgi:hypothetical protein
LQAPLDQEVQGIACVTLPHKPIAAGQVPGLEFNQQRAGFSGRDVEILFYRLLDPAGGGIMHFLVLRRSNF